jgi:TPR repeat protein
MVPSGSSTGSSSSQCNLGVCYANGEGVAKDLEEAYFWFSLAEVNGNKTAAENRALLENELTDEQKERIKERVQKWIFNR